jgi:hypothetical protein
MIKIKCEKCNKELKKQGALIFSPPRCEGNNNTFPSNEVLKFHICLSCYSRLCDWLEK